MRTTPAPPPGSRSTGDPDAGPPQPTTSQVGRRSISSLAKRPEAGALVGTVAVFVFFAIFGGQQFLSLAGAASWVNVGAELSIIALPVGALMIAGELDLSVGSVLAASSITFAIISGYWGAPDIVGILAALAVGLIAGSINGILTVRTRVPSFIITLGMQFALAGLTLGLANLITSNTSVNLTPGHLTKAIFGTLIFGGQYEVSIFWALGVAVVLAWVLQKTRYGNWIFATGGDRDSALSAGVPVSKVKISLFIATALGASLLGIIQTALYNGAQTSNGQSYVFNSIIAVVIGGVLLTGGYGSVIGVVFGTATFAIVNQGIYYTTFSSEWANLILGVLLLVAVLMNNSFRRAALSAGMKRSTSTTKGWPTWLRRS